jgi:hypothetical protein
MSPKEFVVRKFLITFQDDDGNETTKRTDQLTFQEATRIAYIERASSNFKFTIKSIIEIN